MTVFKAIVLPLIAVAVLASASLEARTAPRSAPRPDLADTAAGTYHGSVISDSRGAGRSDVTITVTKTAPGTVRVTSDYGRLPPFTIKLTRAMSTIQQVGTSVVFLLELAKQPPVLGVTDDEASFSGSKE